LQSYTARQKEIIVPNPLSGSIVTIAFAAASISAAIWIPIGASAQAPTASGPALKTPWGEPDLQGIWTDEFDTPLQRPIRYVNPEFFTEAQREELDRQRGALYGSDPRQERGTAVDVGSAYNTAFLTVKHAGARTSLIVDPPNGRIPPATPQAQQAAAADREFRLALLQSTQACKTNAPVCAGGKYDPTPSPRFAEPPPRYHAGNFVRLNRSDGPEDDGLADRCLHSGLPDFGSLFGGSFRNRAGSRFFVPTCAGEAAAGADRVKGGRGAGLSTRAVLWRPSLDAVEHAAKLDAVGLESSAPSPS
jgi:hypothetical protein